MFQACNTTITKIYAPVQFLYYIYLLKKVLLHKLVIIYRSYKSVTRYFKDKKYIFQFLLAVQHFYLYIPLN